MKFRNDQSYWCQVGIETWDQTLSCLGGHPLQSAAWGESRRNADNTDSIYLAIEDNGIPTGLARIEIRSIPFIGKVAWIPRGPVLTEKNSVKQSESLCRKLKELGFELAVLDPYEVTDSTSSVNTMWVDLSVGEDSLKKKMSKQWLYRVRRAARAGVNVVEASSEREVTEFYSLCHQISHDKGFELPGSESLMHQFLSAPGQDGFETRLFLAKFEDNLGAGAFIARSGKHIHYFWGASDRKFSGKRVGEAVQWAAINWGIEAGCTRYDLEGIDPMNNPGVYAFKKKMGGDEVALTGHQFIPLTLRGQIAGIAKKLSARF